MAGTCVGPGEHPANLSRRSFIGATAATAIPLPLTPEQLSAWQTALQTYGEATTAYTRYADGRLQPAWQALQAGKITSADFDALELAADRLGSTVSDSASALFGLPCPDAAGLITKMEIAHEELFRNEPHFCEVFELILADAQRMFGSCGAKG